MRFGLSHPSSSTVALREGQPRPGGPFVLRFELSILREEITALLSDRGNRMEELTRQYLAETLTEEWVADQVREAVREAVRQAIKSIATSHQLRITLEQSLVSKIAGLVAEEDT